jgi:hypothetical protein
VVLVVSIIVAGILVGVQTYPSLSEDPNLDALDLAVQCIFTADCVFKIIQEGAQFWLYWSEPFLTF